MEETIVVNEKYSNNWKTMLYSSLAFAAITFIMYLNLNDVLWSGIVRLTAFISFSLSIFCMLKVMEGRKTFRLSVNDDSLHISYLKNNNIVQEDVLNQNKIESVYKVPSFYKLPLIDYQFSLSNTCNFKVRFTDSDRDISLLTFGGRFLSVDKETGIRLEEFLKAHNLYSHP